MSAQGQDGPDLSSRVCPPTSKVSDISGRGVGMDVVKTNLDRLGGKVEIISVVGKGTTFRIKLPLTLAIIPSLIVSVEGERFAIPQINVEEMLPGAARRRPRPASRWWATPKCCCCATGSSRWCVSPICWAWCPPTPIPKPARREVDRRTRLGRPALAAHSGTG